MSTETLILFLTEKWKHIIDGGQDIVALFIDFRKTFYSIDHQILLKKLKGFWLNGSAFEIVVNYLTDRHQ